MVMIAFLEGEWVVVTISKATEADTSVVTEVRCSEADGDVVEAQRG